MACIGLAIAVLAMPGTQPAIDPAHALMEPPPDPQPRPYVRPPAGSAVAGVVGSGMYRRLVALSRPQSALTLVVAAVLLTCLVSPSTASAMLLHVICFIGSLVEPFDSVLPNKFFLRPFIAQASLAPERASSPACAAFAPRLPPRFLLRAWRRDVQPMRAHVRRVSRLREAPPAANPRKGSHALQIPILLLTRRSSRQGKPTRSSMASLWIWTRWRGSWMNA